MLSLCGVCEATKPKLRLREIVLQASESLGWHQFGGSRLYFSDSVAPLLTSWCTTSLNHLSNIILTLLVTTPSILRASLLHLRQFSEQSQFSIFLLIVIYSTGNGALVNG